jgi:hypothetical protein
MVRHAPYNGDEGISDVGQSEDEPSCSGRLTCPQAASIAINPIEHGAEALQERIIYQRRRHQTI